MKYGSSPTLVRSSLHPHLYFVFGNDAMEPQGLGDDLPRSAFEGSGICYGS